MLSRFFLVCLIEAVKGELPRSYYNVKVNNDGTFDVTHFENEEDPEKRRMTEIDPNENVAVTSSGMESTEHMDPARPIRRMTDDDTGMPQYMDILVEGHDARSMLMKTVEINNMYSKGPLSSLRQRAHDCGIFVDDPAVMYWQGNEYDDYNLEMDSIGIIPGANRDPKVEFRLPTMNIKVKGPNEEIEDVTVYTGATLGQLRAAVIDKGIPVDSQAVLFWHGQWYMDNDDAFLKDYGITQDADGIACFQIPLANVQPESNGKRKKKTNNNKKKKQRKKMKYKPPERHGVQSSPESDDESVSASELDESSLSTQVSSTHSTSAIPGISVLVQFKGYVFKIVSVVEYKNPNIFPQILSEMFFENFVHEHLRCDFLATIQQTRQDRG